MEPRSECCTRAELAAAYFINRAAGAPPDCLITENAAFARRVYNLLRGLQKASPEIIVRKNKKLKKNASYIVRANAKQGLAAIICGVPEDPEQTQTPAGVQTKTQIPTQVQTQIQTPTQTQPPTQTQAQAQTQTRAKASGRAGDVELLRKLIRRKCCKKAALRGAFLAGGSITDPEKLYHLEIYCKKYELARYFSSLMADFGLNPKVMERTDYCVVYVKDSERIVDFLNMTGAYRALMALENTRIIKGMRNSVNRAVNCETANLEKTVNASITQLTNIMYLKETIGFDALPENLREIAELREANREISLKELGQILNPPLGKSGVNHRLRKLGLMAEDIRQRNASDGVKPACGERQKT